MSEWQPIETAPKDGTWFLACCEDGCIDRMHWIVRWDAKHKQFICSRDTHSHTPLPRGTLILYCLAFWMPLPEAPQ